VSSNETWPSSIEGEDSDNDLEQDKNGSIYQKVPIGFQYFDISINKVDSYFEYVFVEEVKELNERLLHEFNTLSNKNSNQTTILNVNQAMNAVFNAELLFSVIGFQNKLLGGQKRE
jgi:hypothetical protein